MLLQTLRGGRGREGEREGGREGGREGVGGEGMVINMCMVFTCQE